jgi:hypothetical protein
VVTHWDNAYWFMKLARPLWPEDVDLAQSRRKGHAAAHRRMQLRYEGFGGLRTLAGIRNELSKVCDEMREVLR